MTTLEAAREQLRILKEISALQHPGSNTETVDVSNVSEFLQRRQMLIAQWPTADASEAADTSTTNAEELKSLKQQIKQQVASLQQRDHSLMENLSQAKNRIATALRNMPRSADTQQATLYTKRV